MAERKTTHFPDFHLPHPDLKILRNPRFLLSVLGLGGLTGTFIGIQHIQRELNKPPVPRSQTIDTPPSFAPAVVPVATVTSTPLKPTQESFPTKESTEISIDKTANLFSSPDSRATFQPYDPSIKVTKDTIIGQFGDFIQVKGEKSSLFLPKQSTQNLPPGLKELSADQISEWPSLADLKSKNKDAGNITVSDVFKVSVNLKENEGLALTDLNGNQLLIQINANSQLYFQSKQGPNIMTAEVGQPGEYNRGTLRIDLKNQKVTFYDPSGKPIVQNVPIDRNVPANPVLLFPDRRIQTAKLNAAGDSNAQILGMSDGRYIDPKTRIPTATAVLPTPEDTRVPAPATVPAKPAAATPTQKPPEATATAIPSPEVTKPFEDIIGQGWTIHNNGKRIGFKTTPDKQARLQVVWNNHWMSNGKGETLTVSLSETTNPYNALGRIYNNQAPENTRFGIDAQLVGKNLVVNLIIPSTFEPLKDPLNGGASWLGTAVNMIFAEHLRGNDNRILTGINASPLPPIPKDVAGLMAPVTIFTGVNQ